MKITKVAVIGGGNGAVTAAADLTERGFQVSLYELEAYRKNLEVVQKKGGITLKEPGLEERFIPFTGLVQNAKEAVDGAGVVMFVVPGYAVETLAYEVIPWLTDGQVIFFNGAAALASVRFFNILQREKIEKKLYICETNSLSYGTRFYPETGVVELSLRVKKLFLAAYPAKDTGYSLDVIKELYACIVPGKNIWHTTLENGNPEVHPGPCLLNTGRIDYSKGEFWLYKEGITKHTIRLLHAIEKERMEIGNELGLELENALESRHRRGYLETETGDLQTLFNESEVYGAIKGPVAVESRYFVEDISEGLVLWSDLGAAVGIKTPNIDAVITLGSTILQTDLRKTGLTLRSVGFKNAEKKELLERVK